MRTHLNRFIYLLAACLASSCFSARLFAEDITILDTSGVVRAQSALDTAPDGTVTMSITDTSTGNPVEDGTVITLTPAAGGAPITALSSGGQVIFSGLPAGAYTVSSATAVTFTSVAISTGVVVASGVAGGTAVVAVAGVAAAGGITAATLSESDSNDDPISDFR